MINKIPSILTILFLIVLISCDKENVLQVQIIGHWDGKEDIRSYDNSGFVGSSFDLFDLQLENDGTGAKHNLIGSDSLLWDVLASNEIQFIEVRQYPQANYSYDTLLFSIDSQSPGFLKLIAINPRLTTGGIVTDSITWILNR